MLHEIDFKEFRSFRRLRLNGLGRVNLIVGTNNSGKTSLLEGLALLAAPSAFGELPRLFRSSEQRRYFRWLVRDGAEEAWLAGKEPQRTVRIRREIPSQPMPAPGPGRWRGHGADEVVAQWPEQQPDLPMRVISVDQKKPQEVISAFAEAVRAAEGEHQMESLLREVDDRIRTVRLDYSKDAQSPFIVVDVGLSERVPLAQTGQAVGRLVTIFSEILGQRPAFLFIDEIENGIHHRVMPKIWKGISEVAERLNVQVFATTHSAECVSSAHEVFSARSDYDLRVIQLYRTNGTTDGRVLDRSLIETGVEENIELR